MEVKSFIALNWLFEKYQQDPNSVWDIGQCFNHEEYPTVEIQELGKQLSEKGFVKNHTVTEIGYRCAITTLGIVQVSNILNEVKFKILRASIEHKQSSVMEILDVEPSHFKQAHDYATYLKRMGIIECIFRDEDIFAAPTFYGRAWYEANKHVN